MWVQEIYFKFMKDFNTKYKIFTSEIFSQGFTEKNSFGSGKTKTKAAFVFSGEQPFIFSVHILGNFQSVTLGICD